LYLAYYLFWLSYKSKFVKIKYEKNMFIVTKYFYLTIIIFQMTGCTNKNKIADLVLLNGNIITVDSANTITEAIAISGDTIFR
jgi:hypothetical protein